MNVPEKLIDPLIVQSVYALRQENRDEAIRSLRQALAIEPWHERLWWLLSMILDDPGEISVCLENVLAINPDNRRAMIALSSLRPDLNGIAIDPNEEVPEADPRRFITGGTVNRRKGIYVTREADRALYERCTTGGFSYVLTARQRGKSSLMMRTSERLRESGIRTARVDLNRIGADLQSIDSLYVSILTEIVRDLKLPLNVAAWWRDDNQSLLSPAKRFEAFIHDELLKALTEPLIIFIDEIDAIRKIKRNFDVDDFFALIRSMHNASAEDETYQRLTFVLLGVARADDLISDPARTPFNIGANIEVADFTLAETRIMTQYLGLPLPYAEQILTWVLDWTGGHPNLTQKVCQRIAEQAPNSRAEVANLIHKLFIVPPDPDNNLKFVGSMLTPEGVGSEVLEMYYRIYTGRSVYEDDDDVATVEQLKLSGIVEVVPYHIGRRRERGLLVIRNRIYESFFDLEWIRDTFQQRYNMVLSHLEIGLRHDSDQLTPSQLEALPEPLFIKPLEQLIKPKPDDISTITDSRRPVQQPEPVSSDERMRRTGTPFDLSEFHPMFQTRVTATEVSQPSKDAAEQANELVQEASHRAYNGYYDQARSLLKRALALDEYNALGWLWLARITENQEERVQYLRKVLEIESYTAQYTGSTAKIASRLLKELTGEDHVPEIQEDPPPPPPPRTIEGIRKLPQREQVHEDTPSIFDDSVDEAHFEESPFESASKQSKVEPSSLFDDHVVRDDFDFDDDPFADSDDDLHFAEADAPDFAEALSPDEERVSHHRPPYYERYARRWYNAAWKLVKGGAPIAAQDLMRLYLWFARYHAVESGLHNFSNITRQELHNKTLYEVLRKPWQVGSAYRKAALAQHLYKQGKPGRAKRTIVLALEDYPAVAEDKRVSKLISKMKNYWDRSDVLVLWKDASLKDDVPDKDIFQQRKWRSRFPRLFTRIRLLVFTVMVMIALTIGLLGNFASVIVVGLLVLPIVLFVAIFRVEVIIPTLLGMIVQSMTGLVVPVFDIFRYRSFTLRMMSAYWLFPQYWILTHPRHALVGLVVSVVVLAAYTLLFQGLLSLGLSAGAIAAGSISLIPIYFFLSLLNAE